MTDGERLIHINDQFRAKARQHSLAASEPIEAKVAKLLELQKIHYEMAQRAGRPSKKPWDISLK